MPKISKPKQRPEHKRFALEYLKNGMNATKAYQVVYPQATYGTARQASTELIAKPSTQAIITAFLKQTSMQAFEVLARLEVIARSSAAEWLSFDENGKPFADLKKLEEAGLLCLVKSIKNTAHGQNIEFHDAVHALELLGKYHKLFTERVSLENPDGTPVVISINVVSAPPRTDIDGIDD